MSRYGIDKAMHRMNLAPPHERAAYIAEIDTLLEGCDLSDEERTAIVSADAGTLYRLGAHPFLLGSFIRNLAGGGPSEREAYIDAIEPFGHPDFST